MQYCGSFDLLCENLMYVLESLHVCDYKLRVYKLQYLKI